MSQHELRTQLDHLQATLRATPAVDDAARAQLAALIDDVQAQLAEHPAPTAHTTSLVDRLRTAAGHFEVSHPQITWHLARLGDTLSQMGL